MYFILNKHTNDRHRSNPGGNILFDIQVVSCLAADPMRSKEPDSSTGKRAKYYENFRIAWLRNLSNIEAAYLLLKSPSCS